MEYTDYLYIFSPHPQVLIVSFLFASSCIVSYRVRTGSTSCRTLQVRIPTLSVTFYQHPVFNSCYISPLFQISTPIQQAQFNRSSTNNNIIRARGEWKNKGWALGINLTLVILLAPQQPLPNNSLTVLFGWRRQYNIKNNSIILRFNDITCLILYPNYSPNNYGWNTI